MKQMKRLFGGALALGVMAALAGCGGGSGSSTSLYAGNYTGAYAGTTSTGSAVSGRFTVTADANGNLTGNLISATNNLPVTGTIDKFGNLRFTTANGANVVAVAGTLGSVDSTYIADGTFSQTVDGVQNASSGKAIAIRKQTGTDQFTGNYAGTFTSTDPTGTNGTLNVTANADGALLGDINTTGSAAVYKGAGVITSAGNLTMYAVSDKGGTPRLQAVTKFNGNGAITNNIATVTGNFATAEAGVTKVKGNFTITEQPVP